MKHLSGPPTEKSSEAEFIPPSIDCLYLFLLTISKGILETLLLICFNNGENPILSCFILLFVS